MRYSDKPVSDKQGVTAPRASMGRILILKDSRLSSVWASAWGFNVQSILRLVNLSNLGGLTSLTDYPNQCTTFINQFMYKIGDR